MLENTENIEINFPLKQINSIPRMLSGTGQIIQFPYILRHNPELSVYGIESWQSQILSRNPSCEAGFIAPKNIPGKAMFQPGLRLKKWEL